MFIEDNLDIVISTTDNYGNYWRIKAILTSLTIKELLIKLLTKFIKFMPSIKEVNGSNYLIKLIKEGMKDE